MRFMVMHKQMEELDESKPIDPKVIKDMSAFVQASIKNGTFVNGAGLKGSKYRTRLTFRGGECVSTQPGPYTGVNEYLAGWAMIKAATNDEALEWAKRFGRHQREADLEVGLVTEPWDLGLMPKPDNAPLRFLVMNKATAKSEAGTPPTEQEMKDMGEMMEAWTKSGVLLSAEGVMPSKYASRLQFKGGKRRTVIDGPFTESKELIGGFSVVQLPSRGAALEWTDQYGAIHGDVEIDLLPLYEG